MIRNQGTGTSRPSLVRWLLDGAEAGKEIIAGIEPGGKAEVMLQFVPGDEIRVVCDADTAISESDETNNERTEVMARPDLVVGDVWTVPANPLNGERASPCILQKRPGVK